MLSKGKTPRDSGYTMVELAVGMMVMAILAGISMLGYNAIIHSSNVNAMSNYVLQIKQAAAQYESTTGSNLNISCQTLVSAGDWPTNGCATSTNFAASFPISPTVTISPVSGQDLQFRISVTDSYFTSSDYGNICLGFQASSESCTTGTNSFNVTF